MRTILIFIALAVIAMIIKRLWQSSGPAENRQIPSGKMVQCAHCGIYTPEADAMKHHSKYYCSQAHVDAHKDAQS